MNCPKCNAILRPGVKFCTSCGQKIETSATCTQCGAPLKSGAKFCIKCGQRVTLAEKTSAPSHRTLILSRDASTGTYNRGKWLASLTKRNLTLITIFKVLLSRKEQPPIFVPTDARLLLSAGEPIISQALRVILPTI